MNKTIIGGPQKDATISCLESQIINRLKLLISIYPLSIKSLCFSPFPHPTTIYPTVRMLLLKGKSNYITSGCYILQWC